MKLLVTGGAGFIGSAFVRLALGEPGNRVANIDKLTYAGNLENLADIDRRPEYTFIHADIADAGAVTAAFEQFRPDAVVHFAAESHVDRSIHSPDAAIRTNLEGTFRLLEAARAFGVRRFVHVSTDEVYGSIDAPAEADESFPLNASSPYSASKAGSDLLALSYHTTFGVPVTVTRASNNYGPRQFPEKLIPLMISNALQDLPLPVYGDGRQVRDWLYVDDHCGAILAVLRDGRPGEVYNIGGSRALANIEIVRELLAAVGKPESLIRYVTDRPGHDRRYALSSDKIEREIGWKPQVKFEDGLRLTVQWYRDNGGWLERVRTGEYQRFYAVNYEARESL
jgi:dTDP-glucose 4,6-dehydratase